MYHFELVIRDITTGKRIILAYADDAVAAAQGMADALVMYNKRNLERSTVSNILPLTRRPS